VTLVYENYADLLTEEVCTILKQRKTLYILPLFILCVVSC